MVGKIVDIRHHVVDTEQDALFLENSLIKEHQPRYNILLKDDKTYPWIVIRNEPFPRVESTRQIVRDGSQYFGPYSSISMQRAILDFIRLRYGDVLIGNVPGDCSCELPAQSLNAISEWVDFTNLLTPPSAENMAMRSISPTSSRGRRGKSSGGSCRRLCRCSLP